MINQIIKEISENSPLYKRLLRLESKTKKIYKEIIIKLLRKELARRSRLIAFGFERRRMLMIEIAACDEKERPKIVDQINSIDKALVDAIKEAKYKKLKKIYYKHINKAY